MGETSKKAMNNWIISSMSHNKNQHSNMSTKIITPALPILQDPPPLISNTWMKNVLHIFNTLYPLYTHTIIIIAFFIYVYENLTHFPVQNLPDFLKSMHFLQKICIFLPKTCNFLPKTCNFFSNICIFLFMSWKD